jgi:arginyl-tRNA synthetase
MLKEELQKLIEKAAGSPAALEHPENLEHGDYSTNVALILAQKLGKNPREVAESIVSDFACLPARQGFRASDFFDKVEVAGPGFINFFLKKEFFVRELSHITKQKDQYGSGKGKEKVVVEFTDPNPFKEFHVGHLYSNTVGESLSRLFEARGAMVRRVNYQGDVGLHVAKALWGMQHNMTAQGINLAQLSKKSLRHRVHFLGEAYAQGSRAFETAHKAKQEITQLNAKIFANEKSVRELYEKGKKWSLEAFEEIYKRLGTKFDGYYFESKVGPIGVKTVQQGLKQGIFEKSQGAITFPGEKYGLHRRVFINSQGLPTYEAKDLGLAPTKYKDFPYDLSIIITGNEQQDYFKVVLSALKVINSKLAEKTKHLSHGMVRLPAGKMSSRTGNVVTGEQLLEEVKSRVRKVMNSSGSAVPRKEQETASEVIAVGAVKYALLRVSLGRDIIFDFEKSLSLQGDSGPYLQYTYARCKSILRKSKNQNLPLRGISRRETNSKLQFSKEELAILRTAYKFSEVVKEAAEKFSPNLICNFAFDLAQRYNMFYNTHRVLQAETKEAKGFRLLLTAAVAQLLKNSLSLLGIKTLERM